MKKLLLILAGLSLAATSTLSITAWTNTQVTQTDSQVNQQKISYHVLSVGNAEFTYVQVDNKAVVIDAGKGFSSKSASDKYRPSDFRIPQKPWTETSKDWEYISQEFSENGVDTIEAVFISHAHQDHYWFLTTMIKNMLVNNIIMPVDNYEIVTNHLINDLHYTGHIYTDFAPTYNFLGIEFENLTAPLKDDLRTIPTNPNNTSMVLRWEMFKQTVLFTGDTDKEEVNMQNGLLLDKIAEKPVDVYIVPHHGSLNSGHEEFLNVIGNDIKYAVISGTFANDDWKDFGAGFKFPYPKTLNLLKQKASQAEVYVTGVLSQSALETDPTIYDQVKGTNHSYVFSTIKTDENNQISYQNTFIQDEKTINNYNEK